MGRKNQYSQTLEDNVQEKLVNLANQTQDTGFLPNDDNQLVELIQAERMSKKLKTELRDMRNISQSEIRALVKLFYQMQNGRIALRAQEREIEQPDNQESGNVKILDYLVKNHAIMEKGVQDALQIVAENNVVGQWLLKITGIGPVLAVGLLAYFDISKCKYASQFISYAGLNDNNRPFIGRVGAQKIFDQLIEKYGFKGKFELSNEFVMEFSTETQWKYDYLLSKAYNQAKQKWDKAALISAAAKIPYNKELKVLCYKIGASFAWQINKPSSLYGRLLAERKAIELQHNEAGDYEDQAKKSLQNKNFDKSTIAYDCYSKGKLPMAQINRRAQRFATKIFLVHLFECMYRVYHKNDPNGNLPPIYYAIEHSSGEHNRYIEPEVPFPA